MRRLVFAAAVGVGLVGGCTPPPSGPPPPLSPPSAPAPSIPSPTTPSPAGPWRCPSWTAVSARPTTDPRIIQPSGLAASRRRAGVWWTHNDTSPPSPKVTSLYALEGSTGDVLATLDVAGVGLGDWEDLDAVMVDGVSELWIADTGDNLRNRPSVQLYRVAEPALTTRGERLAAAADVAVTLRYPDGPHNVEAMFADVSTGDLFLVTKETPPKVFRVPSSLLDGRPQIDLAAPVTLLATVDPAVSPPGKPTAAEMSADGSLLVVKTLHRTFLWHRRQGETVVQMLIARPAGDCIYATGTTRQEGITPQLPDLGMGEAIALTVDGRTLATIAEGPHRPLLVWRAA